MKEVHLQEYPEQMLDLIFSGNTCPPSRQAIHSNRMACFAATDEGPGEESIATGYLCE